MNVSPNPVLAESPFPGILHATLAGSAHQIVNAGPEALHVVAVFSQSPVAVKKPDGALVQVPWPT